MENTKMYLDKFDIMRMFDCGETKALMIIRCIKSVSDTLHLKGKVTQLDFDCWYNKTSAATEGAQKRGANA